MLYSLTIFAFALDWYSTIIQQNYLNEENPIMRWVWSYGDVWFTLVSLVFMIGCLTIIYLAYRFVTNYWLRGLLTISIVSLMAIKILIGLANLGNLTAYHLTEWIVF